MGRKTCWGIVLAFDSLFTLVFRRCESELNATQREQGVLCRCAPCAFQHCLALADVLAMQHFCTLSQGMQLFQPLWTYYMLGVKLLAILMILNYLDDAISGKGSWVMLRQWHCWSKATYR